MTKKKNLIIFLVLFCGTLFEFIYFLPRFFYYFLFLINISIFYVIYSYSKYKITEKKFLSFLIPPILFTNSLIVFLSIVSNKFFIQFLIFLNLFYIIIYIKQYYYSEVIGNKNIKWVSFSSYTSFLIVFFSSSSVYGLHSLLSFPVLILIFFILFTIFLTTYQSFYFNNIDRQYYNFFVFFVSFLLIEISWALFFLPFSYYVLGLILSICYYIIISLTKLFLKNSLNKKNIKFFLIFGISSILLILFTAKIS